MDSGNTRDRLIRAAERLFAQRGIDAVSLREINVAAGQRNTSASHYHFGSKEALVEAIFDFRQSSLGRRRKDLLASLLASHPKPSMRQLVEVLAQPLFDSLDDDDAQHYLLFLSQLVIHPPPNWATLIERQDGGIPPVALAMNEHLNLPVRLLRHRIATAAQFLVTALASRCRLQAGVGNEPLPMRAYTLSLLDGVTAYMAAPVSDEVKAALEPALAT